MKAGKEYIFRTVQVLEVDRDKAWHFFSDPFNLAKITPAYLGFKIRSDLKPGEFFEGMKIRYSIRPLLRLPMNWETLIAHVKPLESFTDIQLKGPYVKWEHTHSFEDTAEGVRMTDEVRYKLPFGLVGNLAHTLFIKKQIENIFSYRRVALNEHLYA